MSNSRYLTDTHITLPFYQEVASHLKPKLLNRKNNGYDQYNVTCPKCHKDGAILTCLKSNTGGLNFVCKCFKDKCGVSYTLNQYITQYGSKEMLHRWRRATIPNYYPNHWYGIKEDSAKPSKKEKNYTFRQRMDLKSIRFMIKVRGNSHQFA